MYYSVKSINVIGKNDNTVRGETMHDDLIKVANPADDAPAYLRQVIDELVKFVADDIHEKIHMAYPELNIDTCNAQVLTVATRMMTGGQDFGRRVVDKLAATLNLV